MRKMSWFIIIVNVLFVVWIVGALASTDVCEGVKASQLEACETGEAIGATIGVGIIVFFWALVDIILGIVWLVTNRGARNCPTCGKPVKKGLTVCKSCGYDFKTGASPA